MATTINRAGITLTNDTGTPASPVGDGTLLSAADRVAVLDAIDGLFTANFNVGGIFSASGFGAHTFSTGGVGVNSLGLRNTTAGTGNYARLLIGNDATDQGGTLSHFSTTWITSGANFQDSTVLEGTRVGGLNLSASHVSGPMRFYTGGVLRLAIDSVGIMTPLNSLKMHTGFLAYNSADDLAVASGSTVDFDTEVFDEGGNFAADTFTAPETGRYELSASVMISNVSGGALNSGARIVCSNHPSGFFIGYASVATGTQELFTGSVIVDMDASDTATVQYYSDTGAATVRGDAAGLRLTWFSGRRVL